MSKTKKKIKRLETVLKVRKIQEDIEKNKMAESVQKVNAYQQQVKMLNDLRDTVYQNIDNETKESVNVSELMKYQVYLRHVHIQTLVAGDNVKNSQKELEEKRMLLREANKKKVAVDKLIEKQKLKYRKEMDKIEEKILDEIANQHNDFDNKEED